MLKKDDTTFIEKDKLDAPNLMSFEQTKDNRKKSITVASVVDLCTLWHHKS